MIDEKDIRIKKLEKEIKYLKESYIIPLSEDKFDRDQASESGKGVLKRAEAPKGDTGASPTDMDIPQTSESETINLDKLPKGYWDDFFNDSETGNSEINFDDFYPPDSESEEERPIISRETTFYEREIERLKKENEQLKKTFTVADTSQEEFQQEAEWFEINKDRPSESGILYTESICPHTNKPCFEKSKHLTENANKIRDLKAEIERLKQNIEELLKKIENCPYEKRIKKALKKLLPYNYSWGDEKIWIRELWEILQGKI